MPSPRLFGTHVKLWVSSAVHHFHDHFVIGGAICPMAVPISEVDSGPLHR